MAQSLGIGGKIKREPEHFRVEEIALDGTVLEIDRTIEMPAKEGDFSHFVLQKRDWETLKALREIGRAMGVGIKRFGYAGMKDRKSISTQLCSAWDIEPEQLLAVKLKDIRINGAWKADKKIEMGDLLGNRFAITVVGAAKGAAEQIDAIDGELGGFFPNYFGEQRFGIQRPITHLVGERILKADWEGAVMMYLTATGEGENEDTAARKELAESRDFGRALQTFPKFLKYERTMLEQLAQHSHDWVGALRRLPRGLSLMFVHAFQSHLFNQLLSQRIEAGFELRKGEPMARTDSYGFPDTEQIETMTVAEARKELKRRKAFPVGRLIGYESEPDELETQLLESFGLTTQSFRIKSFPELSSKGGLRPLLAPYKAFSSEVDKAGVTLSFELPSGSYATVLLSEFMGQPVPC